MQKRLENYYKAAFPFLVIQTAEEKRAQDAAIRAAKETGKSIFTWSITEGMKQVSPAVRDIPGTQEPDAAFQKAMNETNAVFLFRDLGSIRLADNPFQARMLRDLLDVVPGAGSVVVAISPTFSTFPTIEKYTTVLDFTLPDAKALETIARSMGESAGRPLNGDAAAIIRALSGLSTTEAENALALSLVETGTMDPQVIYREKTQGVKRSGLLEITEPDPAGLDAIGGNGNLKTWTIKRRRAFTPDAVKFGLPAPKGVLLIGPPGTGKSISAKAIGTALGVPTLRLDLGALFNSLVGESENRTRAALQLAEALSPVVLWIDEIDKGLAGSSGSGSNDSGVTKRVFGTIISWLQERRRPVFLVATANDVTALPPELLRKGRFDEMFFIDLPTAQERQEIFKIHLEKRGRGALVADLGDAIRATDTFSGSEIEAIIVESLFNAFDQGRDITVQDIVDAAAGTVPLATTAQEKIFTIREWAKTRARPASAKSIQDTTTQPQPRKIAAAYGRGE